MPDPRPNPFLSLRGQSSPTTPLPATESLVEAGHRWEREEIDALVFAAAARRPLLVRGEAGCGKSQLARAAAAHCGAKFFYEVIHPRFEALDLLYRFDVVARLSDARPGGDLDLSNERYVKEGALWRAMEAVSQNAPLPVLLIDEIDKADAEIPNALLEVLGNRSFTVPPRGDLRISSPHGMPLVVITTNEERELPAAFVRRCAVLNLSPPSGDEAFVEWLMDRGNVHRPLKDVAEEACRLAARQVLADRKASESTKVGLAEYIDLLHAVHELTAHCDPSVRSREQIRWIKELGAYALVKGPSQDQRRMPLEPESSDPPGGSR